MVLSYYGLGMVKATVGDFTVAFNPIADPPAGGGTFKPVRFGADIALVSLNDEGYNGIDAATRGDRVPFAVSGPGEYEVGGTFIRGVASVGPEGKINTIYSMILDGIKLVHLGALADPNIAPEAVEALGAIDILFVPVGYGGTIKPEKAAKLAADLEPKLIIPVAWEDEAALKPFLKELGGEKKDAVETLALKRKDIAEKAAEVAIIKSYK